MSIVIFWFIACNALKMLVDHNVNLIGGRNLTIFAGPTILGVGMATMGVSIPLRDYSIPRLVVASLLGIFLNLVLSKSQETSIDVDKSLIL